MALTEIQKTETIRIVRPDGPHWVRRYHDDADAAAEEMMLADWFRFQGVTLIDALAEETANTVSFNLVFTMRHIGEAIEAGALNQVREVELVRNGDHSHYLAKFITHRIGYRRGKTIVMIQQDAEKGRQELFRINVMPSLATDYNVQKGAPYSGGPAQESYTLTPRDNALLQELSWKLRQLVPALETQ